MVAELIQCAVLCSLEKTSGAKKLEIKVAVLLSPFCTVKVTHWRQPAKTQGAKIKG